MADRWSEDAARAYLPRLRLLLGVIRRASQLAQHVRGNGHAKMPDGPAPAGVAGARPPEAPGAEVDEPEAAGETLPPGVDAAGALAELQSKGVVLRDVERGLVDFPARHPSGRDILLCWRLGEDDLGWWHLPEEGFAGRRPLPLPPEL